MSSPRRGARLLLAAALSATGLTWLAPSQPAYAEAKPALSVRLDSLAPAVLTRKGTITLAGTLTNTSEDTWRDINVHAATSNRPMTSTDQISAAYPAADTDLGLVRLQDPTAFKTIGDLKAHQSQQFTLRIPRRALGIGAQPGSYWVGLQVLGTSPEGRDDVADARTRTLITQLGRRTPVSRIALTMPVRAKVRTRSDGSPLRAQAWQSALAERGRLERVLGFIEQAPARRLTLLVDPAVPQLVATLAEAEEPTAAEIPSTWLARFQIAAREQPVINLGYAEPDVSSIAHFNPQLTASAYRIGEQVLADLAVPSTPGVAPFDGAISNDSLATLPERSRVLLGANVGSSNVAAESLAGQVLTRTVRTPATNALDLRQWILAAAAARAGDPRPLVIQLPSLWAPGAFSPAGFFDGLDQPWLQLQQLPLTSQARPVPLPYPETAKAAEFGDPVWTAARNVRRAGDRYATTVMSTDTEAFTAMSLQTLSYQARADRNAAIDQANALSAEILNELSGIQVDPRAPVNLAGGSGTVLITMVNNLDRPVLVGLRSDRRTPGLSISKVDPVQLNAGQRTTVRLSVSSDQIGVYSALLSPVNADGQPVGTPLPMTIRSSNVTRWVWVLMGGGAAVLFGAIIRRIRKHTLKPRSEPEFS